MNIKKRKKMKVMSVISDTQPKAKYIIEKNAYKKKKNN